MGWSEPSSRLVADRLFLKNLAFGLNYEFQFSIKYNAI